MGAGRPGRGRYLLLQALWEGCATVTLCTQVFAMLTPDHWCADEHVSALRLQLPLSHLEAKKFSLPPVTIGLPLLQLWMGGNVSTAFSQCERYEGDMAAAYIRWMVARRPPHPTSSSLPSRPCDQGWEYNASALYTTMPMQYDWVCNDNWRPYVIQVSFWVGAGIGALVFGLAANRFGRYPVLLVSIMTILLGDVLTLSLDGFGFSAVLASRFVAGSGCLILQYVSLVHLREVCGVTQQEWLLLVAIVTRTTSSLLVTAVALVVPSWWYLVLLPTFTSTTCLLLTSRLCHESPWWLLERDRPEDAIKVLRKTASTYETNTKPVDRQVLLATYAAAMQTRHSSYEYCQCCRYRNETVPFTTVEATAVSTKLCRRHDVILNVVWMVCGASYYAQFQSAPLVLSTARNSRLALWDAAESFWLAAAAELPACTLPHLLRRGHHVTGILQVCSIAAAALSAACALTHSSQEVGMTLAALSRLSATSAMCAALHLVLQCRVSNTQVSGIAVTTSVYGLAAATGPAINFLTEYNTRLPSLILAFMNFVGVMLSLALSRRRIDKPPIHSSEIRRRWEQMLQQLSRYLPQRFANTQAVTSPHQPANPIVISSVPYNQLRIVG